MWLHAPSSVVGDVLIQDFPVANGALVGVAVGSRQRFFPRYSPGRGNTGWAANGVVIYQLLVNQKKVPEPRLPVSLLPYCWTRYFSLISSAAALRLNSRLAEARPRSLLPLLRNLVLEQSVSPLPSLPNTRR